MAIGACFHDETHSLRAQATGWIYEARFWLLLPPEKARLTIPGLQIMCLLLLAKQTAGVAGDLTWISAGSLFRAAMHVGLHHDPDNLTHMPRLRAEMRRRLWVTILEICLQASLDAGGLPLISLRDFDTRPPANLDEQDILEESGRDVVADRDRGFCTQMSVQIAMFESFATRLAITNLINDPQCSVSEYQETLRLSSELVTVNRAVMERLHSFSRDERGVKGVSPFQLRFLEMAMNRYLLALHLPWWHEALRSPSHYFSRKMSVDAALTLVALARTGPPAANAPEPSPSITDFTRLFICGSGPYRSAPIHACLTISLEFMFLKEEERKNHGLMTALGSGELRAIFDWTTDWWARRIRAGETNIKSYVFGPVVISHLEALESSLDHEATMALVMEQATVRVEECYKMLKAVAGDVEMGDGDEPAENQGGAAFGLDFMDDFLDDWDWDNDMVGFFCSRP
jgi:hypothetical protein